MVEGQFTMKSGRTFAVTGGTRVSADSGSRLTVLAVLEFLAGGIVVLGGAALIYFALDTLGLALGTIHFTLGLAALLAGYLLLTRNATSWKLTLGVNTLLIVFSAVSEAIIFTASSLPSDAFVDSIIGTLVAIVIAAAVILQLMTPTMRAVIRRN